MASNEIFVAKESFSATLDGESIAVHKGVTRVRAGHPLLKGREMFFEPLTVQYDVEQATSKPGESRAAKPDPEPEPQPAAQTEPDPEPEPAKAPAKSKDK